MAIGTGISPVFLSQGIGEVVSIFPPDPGDIIIDPATLSLTLPVPANTKMGDMLIALISTDGNPTLTTPAGWDLEDDIGNTAKSFIYRRLSPGGEPASYTWDLDGVEDAIGAIIRFANVDPDDSINAKVENSGTAAVIPIPSITTTVDKAMLLTIISLNDGVLIDLLTLRNARQVSLWIINSSGAAIGSVGSSAAYKTLKKAGAESGYNLQTEGLVVTDYYVIQIALAPDVEILYKLTDSNNNQLLDSDGNKLLAE